jgi:hypothetical protein
MDNSLVMDGKEAGLDMIRFMYNTELAPSPRMNDPVLET